MAELTEPTSSCCAPEQQSTCCEPSEKAGCCHEDSATCGCAAGAESPPVDDLREAVRARYAAAAMASGGSCCAPEVNTKDERGEEVFGAALYGQEASDAPAGAVDASLGCGVPTAVAALDPGEIVLDLGSGGGTDVLISARRVGPTGRAIGLDMTDEMLELARRNAREAGVENVEWIKGHIEKIPLPDASVDVVISNCVINLSGDKQQVLREAARVLKPGGRFAVSDVVADPDMDDATRADMQQWTGCIAGALTREEFQSALEAAGFADVEIRETHRVHQHASSAIVRARRPRAGAEAELSISECRLDLDSLHAQRERYRALGASVQGITREGSVLSIDFNPTVDEELLRRTVAVERDCCPFFDLHYDDAEHQLRVAVPDPRHEPALDAIVFALGGQGRDA